jgi:predicted cupin superfamily sugar epimerase
LKKVSITKRYRPSLAIDRASNLETASHSHNTIPSIKMAATKPRTAAEVITLLNLSPHPEKGYYIETFRDAPSDHSTTTRAASTYIYYLLDNTSGNSHWHRVLDAVEAWHYYAGAPLQLSLSWNDGTPIREHVLGPDLWEGQRPQVVIQRGEWQAAKTLGEWTLVGCSVAPGFEFGSFEMADEGWVPDEGAAKK